MPYSYPYFKNEFKQHLIESDFSSKTNILDVGAGSGGYSHLLKNDFPFIDALEIYPPYIDMFKLQEHYREVFIGDILTFDFSKYDYLIMGDIVEHLYIEDAQVLISTINRKGKYCMIAVPYLFEQGEEYGNKHEIHHQSDLTHEIFMCRYPTMNLLWNDNKYGYYINYHDF